MLGLDDTPEDLATFLRSEAALLTKRACDLDSEADKLRRKALELRQQAAELDGGGIE
jgi:hypothetical protein